MSIVNTFKELTAGARLAYWSNVFSIGPRRFTREEQILAGNFAS